MTLRAGSYDKHEPDWRGLIRDDGWPLYECYHWGDLKHSGPDEARACARSAIEHIKSHNTLPEYWTSTEEARNARANREKARRGNL